MLLICCQKIPGEEPQRLADAQLARFRVSSSKLGIFAARHESLDYRLRTAPDVKFAVEGGLDIMCKHLLKRSSELSEEEFNALYDASLSHVPMLAGDLLLKSTPDDDARIKELERIHKLITALHRLSRGIRATINWSILVVIPDLLDIDTEYVIIRERGDDGAVSESLVDGVRFDIGYEFTDYVRETLTHKWFGFHSDNEQYLDDEQKNYRRILLERCVTAISTRRRQLAYFQAHQSRSGRNEGGGIVSQPSLVLSSGASTTVAGGFENENPFDIPPPPELGEKGEEKGMPLLFSGVASQGIFDTGDGEAVRATSPGKPAALHLSVRKL